jgi:hypothetical protein
LIGPVLLFHETKCDFVSILGCIAAKSKEEQAVAVVTALAGGPCCSPSGTANFLLTAGRPSDCGAAEGVNRELGAGHRTAWLEEMERREKGKQIKEKYKEKIKTGNKDTKKEGRE